MWYENEGEKNKNKKNEQIRNHKKIEDQIQITEELTIEFQYTFYIVSDLLLSKQKL